VPRPAPAVDRAIAILKHLAHHPDHHFTLTDFVRELSLNPASCHAVLQALVRHGFLERDDRTKTYMLGSALIEISQHVAPARSRALTRARALIRQLAYEYDLLGVVGVLEGMEQVALARTSRTRSLVYSPGGEPRRRWRPPLGRVFAAYGTESERNAWLGQLEGPKLDEQIEQARAALSRIRQAGFDVAFAADLHTRLITARRMMNETLLASVEEIAALGESLATVADLSSDLRSQIADGHEGADVRAHTIYAPVFDAEGVVLMVVQVSAGDEGFPSDVQHEISARILAGVTKITNGIGGLLPADWPATDN
jgi:DNA-binding IclR family transcriptional regulator